MSSNAAESDAKMDNVQTTAKATKTGRGVPKTVAECDKLTSTLPTRPINAAESDAKMDNVRTTAKATKTGGGVPKTVAEWDKLTDEATARSNRNSFSTFIDTLYQSALLDQVGTELGGETSDEEEDSDAELGGEASDEEEASDAELGGEASDEEDASDTGAPLGDVLRREDDGTHTDDEDMEDDTMSDDEEARQLTVEEIWDRAALPDNILGPNAGTIAAEEFADYDESDDESFMDLDSDQDSGDDEASEEEENSDSEDDEMMDIETSGREVPVCREEHRASRYFTRSKAEE